jgi:hypothetical protein
MAKTCVRGRDFEFETLSSKFGAEPSSEQLLTIHKSLVAVIN